jgi:hypothetical protein
VGFRPIAVLVAMCLTAVAGAATAQAPAELKIVKTPGPKKVALVVGMSRYRHIPTLDNPKNDATLMASTLRDVGFALLGGGPQLDLDKAGFDAVVQQFGQRIVGADVALFYYAGHGLQVRGTNWLVPTSANPTREVDVDFQMVDANLVLRQMESAGTRLNLLILDACRNNPFGGRGLRASVGGLAQMQAPEGTLISYATQPGNVAADGADGNSPYTKALAQTIKRPGLDVFKLFNEVGLQVKRVTGGVQQPWVSNSPIDGDFYFMAVPPGSTVTVQPPGAAPASPPDAEMLFWQSIANSAEPGDYEAYLRQYPAGRFTELARARIAGQRLQVATAPSNPPPSAKPGATSQDVTKLYVPFAPGTSEDGMLQQFLVDMRRSEPRLWRSVSIEYGSRRPGGIVWEVPFAPGSAEAAEAQALVSKLNQRGGVVGRKLTLDNPR